jgi:hypothetical protein
MQFHILNDSVAADVSVVTAAAYSPVGVTTAVIAEAVAADVTVATATSANLSTAEAAVADLPVPVDTAALSSAGKAIAEAAATDVSLETAASKTDEEEKATLDNAEGNIQNKGVKGVSVLGWFFINSYMIWIHNLNESMYSLLF